jgi:NADPH2:quinone reductase
MKYVTFELPGKAECMFLADGEPPTPAAGQIMIEVAYAGINRPDIIQRKGHYPPPPGASPVLGLEVSGRVAKLGKGVVEWQVGDLVAALVPGGGYAEYCVVPAGHALPIPAGISLAEAAGLPETWFTVWANLIEIGRISADECLLIHGGAGGIGLAAIQLGKLIGCKVFATVGTDEKASLCRNFGADLAINYKSEDFVERVRTETHGKGVDLVLDVVGAPYLQKNIDLLRQKGRLVIIGFLGGNRGEIDLTPVMTKRLLLTGSTLRPRSVAEKAALRDALLGSVWPAIGDGRIRPHPHVVFPFSQVVEAHRLMESNQHAGKIILQFR